ncbi:cytochrome P450 [Marasmius fiardii PR-910]|nr:cytochrome P450 [Marasmius fiardii PR-910]
MTAPSTFAEMDPKEHAIIRGMIAPFFSRRSVLALEGVIQGRIDRLIQQLLQNHQTLPVDMNLAFRSATLDIITLYTFGISINTVSTPLFQHPVLLDSDKHARNKWIFKHFPFIKNLMMILPSSFAAVMGKKASFNFVKEITKLVDDALDGREESDSRLNRNIYHTLLSDSTGSTKKLSRLNRRWLIGEGQNLRGAGSDTVGNTCTIGARYILSDMRVLRKLQHELDTAWQDKNDNYPLDQLERIPYLTAVIKESLRLAHGVVTPMPRIVPDAGLVIAGHLVPVGTSVAVGNTFVHMNPTIFPNPTRFFPERWLQEGHHKMERYLVAFGKGSRSCLGITYVSYLPLPYPLIPPVTGSPGASCT